MPRVIWNSRDRILSPPKLNSRGLEFWKAKYSRASGIFLLNPPSQKTPQNKDDITEKNFALYDTALSLEMEMATAERIDRGWIARSMWAVDSLPTSFLKIITFCYERGVRARERARERQEGDMNIWCRKESDQGSCSIFFLRGKGALAQAPAGGYWRSEVAPIAAEPSAFVYSLLASVAARLLSCVVERYCFLLLWRVSACRLLGGG